VFEIRIGLGQPEAGQQATRYTAKPTAAETRAILAGTYVRSAVTASVAVTDAKDVPTRRPPMFAAKLSPVERIRARQERPTLLRACSLLPAKSAASRSPCVADRAIGAKLTRFGRLG
jgi:hypothetical protein